MPRHQRGRSSPTTLRLRNCPFHPLTAKAPEFVCGINHAFLTGFLHGLQATTVHAVLAPHPPKCCVAFHAAPPPQTSSVELTAAATERRANHAMRHQGG